MKKRILLVAILSSAFSFAQECCNVVSSNGNNAVSSNGACVITSAIDASTCVKNAPIAALPIPVTATTPVLKPEENNILINALEGVKFRTNSDELLPQSFSKLDAVAELLKAHSNFKLKINGYTDNTGASDYNHELSHKRANAAKARLVQDGIEASRITTHGYGEENPIATNDTAEGRAKNRRVEFKVAF